MSNNYHSGSQSSATPRLHSSTTTQDKSNSAQTLSQQAKIYRPESKYSENSRERKSPINNVLMSPKYPQENFEVEILESIEKNRNGQVQFLSAKETKKISQSVKENIYNKAISPLKPESNTVKKTRKTSTKVGPLVMINEYETVNTSRQKPNSAKSMSLQQDVLHHHLQEAKFGDWLSNKVQSTRNPAANDNSGHKVQSLDLGNNFKSILRKHQHSTTDLHNIWPEAKKAKKVEILSHRQNLDTPRDTDLTNKSGQKHLGLSPIRSSTSTQVKKGAHDVKSLIRNKMISPKGSIGDSSAREQMSHVSPSNLQNVHNFEHHHPRISPIEKHILRNSCQDEFQKESMIRDSVNLHQNQRPDLPFISKLEIASPNPMYNNNGLSNKHSMSPLQTPITSGTTTEELRPQLQGRLGRKFEISVQTRPLNLGENIKSNRESEVQFEPYSVTSGGDHLFSTRSALDRCENRLNVLYSAQDPQRIYINANTNKNTPIDEVENKNPVTQDIIKELLKRTNSKETFVNPNAKFLMLRKQVQDKRSKATFKSADWSIPNSPNNFQENNVKDSSRIKQTKTPETAEFKPESNISLRNQMEQLLKKTKLMMKDFKSKENQWDKEKQALQAEILHLRSIIENL